MIGGGEVEHSEVLTFLGKGIMNLSKTFRFEKKISLVFIQ